MAKRGRPVESAIRQRIVEILYFLKEGYGYEISKIYMAVYPKVTMRSIYYHLNRGVSLGEFKVNRIKAEKGNYSWGPEAQKKYYALGSNAKPKMDKRVKEYLDKKKKSE